MMELAKIEREIAECNQRLNELRLTGLHLLKADGTSGRDAVRWLIDRGMSGQGARELCAALIAEGRSERT